MISVFISYAHADEKLKNRFLVAKDGRCKVIPVILKPSLWRDIPIDDEGGRLGDFVALPHDGKPVTGSRHGRESALDSVVCWHSVSHQGQECIRPCRAATQRGCQLAASGSARGHVGTRRVASGRNPERS